MKKTLMIACLLMLYIGSAQTQTLNYEMTSKGDSIGHLTATKTIKGNSMQIDVVSEVGIRILIKVSITYKLHCTYINDELVLSSATSYVDGKVHSTSKTEKTGDHYTITKDGHTSMFLDKIDFSNGLLYFEAPKNTAIVFSESNGLEKKVKQTGTNTYDVTNPENGHVSKYSYAANGGVLEKSTVHNTYTTFVLTKQ